MPPPVAEGSLFLAGAAIFMAAGKSGETEEEEACSGQAVTAVVTSGPGLIEVDLFRTLLS